MFAAKANIPLSFGLNCISEPKSFPNIPNDWGNFTFDPHTAMATLQKGHPLILNSERQRPTTANRRIPMTNKQFHVCPASWAAAIILLSRLVTQTGYSIRMHYQLTALRCVVDANCSVIDSLPLSWKCSVFCLPPVKSEVSCWSSQGPAC